MSSYETYESYDLAELTAAVHLPWHEFAGWADQRMPDIRPSLSNPKLGTYRHGYHSSTCSHGPFGSYPDEWANWEVLVYEPVRGAIFRACMYPDLAQRLLGERRIGGKSKEEVAHEVVVADGQQPSVALEQYVRWIQGRAPLDNRRAETL